MFLNTFLIFNFLVERNFDIGKLLEFKLDFKTSELNGVLLSVTESAGTPSFSLELQNGNVSYFSLSLFKVFYKIFFLRL